MELRDRRTLDVKSLESRVGKFWNRIRDGEERWVRYWNCYASNWRYRNRGTPNSYVWNYNSVNYKTRRGTVYPNYDTLDLDVLELRRI